MGKQAFETSLRDGAHRQLAQMAGAWQGTYTLWFGPGEPACQSAQRGHIRAILGGRFLLHEYEAEVQGEPMSGAAIYGCHLDDGNWESAWIESFGTGTQVMHSSGRADHPCFRVLGSYGDGSGGPRWGWRTEIEQPDADTLLIVMFNISPEGVEEKAVETRDARMTCIRSRRKQPSDAHALVRRTRHGHA